jgi:hypothetical protein
LPIEVVCAGYASIAAPQRVPVTVYLPADLVAQLKEQPLGLEGEIVSSMQFFREIEHPARPAS